MSDGIRGDRRRLVVGTALLLVLVLALPRGSAIAAQDEKPIALFNGKNVDGWYFHTVQAKGENPGIFTIEEGLLKIAGGAQGEAYLGGMITKEEYSNYRLVVEYKWGGPTYGARANAARDSGILLHAIGPNGPGPWMTSIECQIIEGGTGDFILIGGMDDRGQAAKLSATTRAVKRGGQYYFAPEGPEVTVSSGRLNWYGRDPDWKDLKGFRGAGDVESPFGEWTRVECLCEGERITAVVNGKTVNQVTKLPWTKGKILIQTEGAEMWVRKIELTPLATAAGVK